MTNQHDLELNAYLDGEMSEAQRLEFEQLLEHDAELRSRLQRFKRLKTAVSDCFQPIEVPSKQKMNTNEPWHWRVAAVVLVLLLGYLSGAVIGMPGDARFVLLGNGERAESPALSENQETRIVFHLTNPDQVVAGDLLDEVEQMLVNYRSQGDLLRVEIVSHGEGLVLLRERLSQHGERIATLADSYDNLVFVACQNTIDRLRVERGVEVMLLPEATVIDSGVSHVVKRQMEGWSYIRV